MEDGSKSAESSVKGSEDSWREQKIKKAAKKDTEVSQDPVKVRKLSQGKTITIQKSKSDDSRKAKANHKPPKTCQYGLAHLRSKRKLKKHFAD